MHCVHATQGLFNTSLYTSTLSQPVEHGPQLAGEASPHADAVDIRLHLLPRYQVVRCDGKGVQLLLTTSMQVSEPSLRAQPDHS